MLVITMVSGMKRKLESNSSMGSGPNSVTTKPLDRSFNSKPDHQSPNQDHQGKLPVHSLRLYFARYGVSSDMNF